VVLELIVARRPQADNAFYAGKVPEKCRNLLFLKMIKAAKMKEEKL
jgi:hypothetical protein